MIRGPWPHAGAAPLSAREPPEEGGARSGQLPPFWHLQGHSWPGGSQKELACHGSIMFPSGRPEWLGVSPSETPRWKVIKTPSASRMLGSQSPFRPDSGPSPRTPSGSELCVPIASEHKRKRTRLPAWRRPNRLTGHPPGGSSCPGRPRTVLVCSAFLSGQVTLTDAFSLTFQKQVLLEKKMAYHLQKMQQNGLRREDTEKNTPDYRGQEGVCSECKQSRQRCFRGEHVAVCVGGSASVKRGLLSLLCTRRSSRRSPIPFKVKSRHVCKNTPK